MGIKDSSLWAREILSFLETAKNGSINGTAEANAMKQSNLSRTLKSLEEKLKCQLLERGYNGVRLTENGMVLIPISLDLKENPQAIKMTSHPSLLTALEGHWHEKMQEVRKSSMMKAIFWKLKKIRQEHFNL